MELSREEARRPDQMTAGLKKGFEWTTSHSQAVIAVVGLALVAGVLFSVWNWNQERTETALQQKFYAAERLYLEKKEKFDQFEASTKSPVDPKAKVPEKPQGEKPTGDVSQDFGPALQGFESLVKEAPASKAGAMAALSLSKIYSDAKKPGEALEALKKSQTVSGDLGAMVKAELGTLTANQGDCKGALEIWSALLKHHPSTFLAPQVKLKMGLCSESLGQKDQAADYYKQVAAEAKESAVGRSAEKFLRALQSGASL